MPLLLELGHGRACQFIDFQGTDDADDIIGVDSVGRFWVANSESVVKRINTELCHLTFKSLSECRIRSRSLKQAVNNHSKVETRTTNKQYSITPVLDVSNRRVCKGLIVGNGKGLGNVYAVYEVMPCRLPFFGGRFGSPDVHLPIDLSGIDGDNFGIEALCKSNCYLSFADCCGTEEAYKS